MDQEVPDFFLKDVVDGDGHTVEGGFERLCVSDVYDHNIIYLDDSQVEVLEDDWVPANINLPKSVTPERQAGVREPSSQSCLEEMKKLCASNQAEIMGALNRVIQLLETQNETLVQVLICLRNKN